MEADDTSIEGRTVRIVLRGARVERRIFDRFVASKRSRGRWRRVHNLGQQPGTIYGSRREVYFLDRWRSSFEPTDAAGMP